MEEQKSLNTLKFDDKEINIIGTREDPWFIVKEIAEILDITSYRIFISNLEFKDFYKMKTKKGIRKVRIMNKDGLRIMLSQTKKYVAKNFLEILKKNFNIYVDIIFFRKETIYIKIIQSSFRHIISYTEYMIGNYRVDLLFPEKKLVVECDEFNHTKYNKEDELERERYIRNEGYNFVRFNPDETDFNIGKVINQIMKKVYDI